jgi:hypothetical protein
MVEAVDTSPTQRQREEVFFVVTLDENGVPQERRIPRSKLRRNMRDFAEQLFWKEIRTIYVRSE